MKASPEQLDLSKSWTFVEQRDRLEDGRLWEEISSLGLPSDIIDVHVHCGQKSDIGDIPLDRLKRIKTLNNRRWYHLSRMRHLHRALFPNRKVDFVTFPFPYLETDIETANRYLLEGRQENEHIFILSKPKDIDYNIKTVSKNRDRVAGVKAYYDQIPISPPRESEEVSTFEFFPKDSKYE